MADVIDDEELIATRKLNGVDDDLYRKIDVGEYIKTNKGNIGKIIEIRLGFNKDTQFCKWKRSKTYCYV